MSEKPRTFTSVERIAITAFCIIAAPVAIAVGMLASGHFRLFYIPSEAMEPTLKVNDRFVAMMGTPEPLRRGDIVIVAVGNTNYVKRVAALPGDTIELVDGIVHLNGRRLAQRRVGVDRIATPGPLGDRAVRRTEQFPGEAEPHQIYEMGASRHGRLSSHARSGRPCLSSRRQSRQQRGQPSLARGNGVGRCRSDRGHSWQPLVVL